jgi:hypothetical protein
MNSASSELARFRFRPTSHVAPRELDTSTPALVTQANHQELESVTRRYKAASVPASPSKQKEIVMAKGEQRGNREQKKPKKEKIKVIAAAPSQKTAGWQPTFGSGKKK